MIYLASAYSHPDVSVREWRYQQACRATAELLRQGLVVLSPIVHSHPLVTYGLPTTWDFWSRIDREYLARCDVLAVLMLPGWETSVGVQAEIQAARELGILITYLEPSEWESSSVPQ
jgi:hypothetical protein